MNELEELQITEISLCGEGKNPGAAITLIKSADVDSEILEEAMILKAYFNEVLAGEKFREEARNIIEPLWDVVSILSTSIRMIYANDMKYPNKKAAIKESISQFADYIKARVDQVVTKSADSSGDLNKSKLEVTKGMDTVVTTYDQAALDKAVEEAVQKAAAPKDMEIKKLSILAKMSDIEKAYYGTLDQEDQILFLNKSTDERVSLAKAHHVEDEVLSIEGITISKAKVGKEAFGLLKTQIAEKENLQYIAKANKEFANLPGTSEEKAKVLKGIDSIQDLALRKAVYDTFEKASAAYNTGLFTEIGETGENISKAADAVNLNNLGSIDTPEKAEKALDILAKAYQKSYFTEKGEQVSISKAYSVIMDTEEGQKLYSLSRLNSKFKR